MVGCFWSGGSSFLQVFFWGEYVGFTRKNTPFFFEDPRILKTVFFFGGLKMGSRSFEGGEDLQEIFGNFKMKMFWLVVSNIFYLHPYLGKISILTNFFQRG